MHFIIAKTGGPTPPIAKTCSKCGKTKPVVEFSKDKGKKDGLRPSCKECMAQYYEANRERILAKNTAWNKASADKVKAQRAAYYAANSEAKKQNAAKPTKCK